MRRLRRLPLASPVAQRDVVSWRAGSTKEQTADVAVRIERLARGTGRRVMFVMLCELAKGRPP
jgi:hypothetical protein